MSTKIVLTNSLAFTRNKLLAVIEATSMQVELQNMKKAKIKDKYLFSMANHFKVMQREKLRTIYKTNS